MPESMTQDFGITDVLGKQAHSRLRNCFSSAVVESKDKSDSGIIEFSLLRFTVLKWTRICHCSYLLRFSEKTPFFEYHLH